MVATSDNQNKKELRAKTKGLFTDIGSPVQLIIETIDFVNSNLEEKQELFDYLNFAYIGGRYRSEEEFPVTKQQLNYWSTEAQKLLNLTQTICTERIECLKGIEKK